MIVSLGNDYRNKWNERNKTYPLMLSTRSRQSARHRHIQCLNAFMRSKTHSTLVNKYLRSLFEHSIKCNLLIWFSAAFYPAYNSVMWWKTQEERDTERETEMKKNVDRAVNMHRFALNISSDSIDVLFYCASISLRKWWFSISRSMFSMRTRDVISLSIGSFVWMYRKQL